MSFVGTLKMSESSVASLTKQFDLATYIQAFGDEETGFSKAFQSLFSDSDHESLDKAGRRVIPIPEIIDRHVRNLSYRLM